MGTRYPNAAIFAIRSTTRQEYPRLVVVPRDDLDEGPAEHPRRRGVEDRRVGILDDVGGNERLLAVLENVAEGWLRRRLLHRRVDPMVVAAQSKRVTPQSIQKEIERGKQYVLVLLKKGPNASAIDSVTLERNQMEHLVHLFTMKAEGALPIFGPVLEDADLRGICIFNTDDKAKVKAMLDEDPRIKSGRLGYELYNWFGLPGDKLPK